jgi:hypothetical protein
MRSKALCYLSGIDWTLYILDYLSRRETGCGHLSQVILALDQALDTDRVRDRLRSFTQLFPAIHGHVARAWNLAPFWTCTSVPFKECPFIAETAASEDAALNRLYSEVNRPFTHAREHLRFLHITVGPKAFFALVFDHRLLDARGAQNFLQLFHKFYCGQFSLPDPFHPERPSGLNQWKEKFLAGQRVNRQLLEIANDCASKHLPVPQELKGHPFLFRTVTFDPAQSAQITESAYDTAGYLMMAPYFLAISLAVFQDIFSENLSKGNSFVIPVNTDIRSRNPGLPELFFNHLSFFFLRFSADDVQLSRGFISKVSRTMYEAMSGGFAQDLAQASLLLRAVPLALCNTVQQKLLRIKGLSFSFSYVNKGYESSDFCGAKVSGVAHTPRLAVDPGVGIFFTQFNGNISMTFSFCEGVVSNEDANKFMAKVQQALLNING